MRNIYFWTAIIWTAIIGVCCLISMKNFESAPIEGKYTDKLVHFTFYFTFTVLWFLALREKNIGKEALLRFKVFIGAVVFGIFIELFQSWFTADRSADVADVIANSSGSAGAVLALWLAKNKLKQ